MGAMDFAWQALVGEWSPDWRERNAPFMRVFYRLKAALCLLLNREPSRRDEYDLWTYSVIVTYTGGGMSPGTVHGPEVHWCEAILVGRGVLRNWWACVAQASSD